MRQNDLLWIVFPNQTSQFVLKWWISIESNRSYWRDPGDGHGGQEKDYGDKEEGEDIQKDNHFPMPADRNNAHVVILWIEFDDPEIVLKEAQSEAEQVTEQ